MGSLFEIGMRSFFSPFSLSGLLPDEMSVFSAQSLALWKILFYTSLFLTLLFPILYFSFRFYSYIYDIRLIPVYRPHRMFWWAVLSFSVVGTSYSWQVWMHRSQNIVYLSDVPINPYYSRQVPGLPIPSDEAKLQMTLEAERDKLWVVEGMNLHIQPSGTDLKISQQFAFRRLENARELRLGKPDQYKDLFVLVNGNLIPPQKYQVSPRDLIFLETSFPERFQLVLNYQIPSRLFVNHSGRNVETVNFLDCHSSSAFVKLSTSMLFRARSWRFPYYLSGKSIPVTAGFEIPLINQGILFPIQVFLPPECGRYKFPDFHQQLQGHQLILSAVGDSIIDIYGYDETKALWRTDNLIVVGVDTLTPEARNLIQPAVFRLSALLKEYGFSAPYLIKPSCFSVFSGYRGSPTHNLTSPIPEDFLIFYGLVTCFALEIPYFARWELQFSLPAILTYKSFVENGKITKTDFMEYLRFFAPYNSHLYDMLNLYVADKQSVDEQIREKSTEVSQILSYLKGKSFVYAHYSLVVKTTPKILLPFPPSSPQ